MTLDHLDWQRFTEVERGALLLDLAATLRMHLEQSELDQSLTSRYLAWADAAQEAGRALLDKADLPFDPDSPFRWSKIPMEEVIQAMMQAQIGPIFTGAGDRGTRSVTR